MKGDKLGITFFLLRYKSNFQKLLYFIQKKKKTWRSSSLHNSELITLKLANHSKVTWPQVDEAAKLIILKVLV